MDKNDIKIKKTMKNAAKEAKIAISEPLDIQDNIMSRIRLFKNQKTKTFYSRLGYFKWRLVISGSLAILIICMLLFFLPNKSPIKILAVTSDIVCFEYKGEIYFGRVGEKVSFQNERKSSELIVKEIKENSIIFEKMGHDKEIQKPVLKSYIKI